ncbi:MAG: LysR substrate-binding domain-containing protein [Spirulinaceae cyanobacterium]
MNLDITLRQLRYFVVVAEELNFTRAAERLQIAQPPLSRQIQSLEKVLAVTLLERTNRRVALTPAGEFFLADCRQILRQVEQTVQATQRIAHGEAGQLVVGFEGSAQNERFFAIIRQFRSQFPEVELILQEMPSGKQVEALQQQRLDVGLIEPIVPVAELTLTPIMTESLVVALPQTHPLATQASIELAQLTHEPWITGRRDQGCGLLLRILEACQQAGFIPNVKQEMNDLQMILGFVASGLGITLLPESSALTQEGIVYCTIAPVAPQISLAAAWQAERRSPVVASFLQIVEACY